MIATLDAAATPANTSAHAPAATVVVIDVLRATSTIVTALDNGAAGVVPVREAEEAITVMRRLGRDRSLLCGERDSRLITGFDLDNSPASYTRERVEGKTLVLTTTNGTRALVEAARGNGTVYCGALINRAAIVERLAAAEGNALLLCAGSEGALSSRTRCARARSSIRSCARTNGSRSPTPRASRQPSMRRTPNA